MEHRNNQKSGRIHKTPRVTAPPRNPQSYSSHPRPTTPPPNTNDIRKSPKDQYATGSKHPQDNEPFECELCDRAHHDRGVASSSEQSGEHVEKPTNSTLNSNAKKLGVDRHNQTYQGDNESGDLPLPEVSSTSILAVLTLGDQIWRLKHFFGLYVNLYKVCHDTPAYSTFREELLSNIESLLGLIDENSQHVRSLRVKGQGTVETCISEKFAAKLLLMYDEVTDDCTGRSEAVVKEKIFKGEDALLTSAERAMLYKRRDWFSNSFINKMLAVLKTFTVDEMNREIEGWKGELKEIWEDKVRRTGRNATQTVGWKIEE